MFLTIEIKAEQPSPNVSHFKVLFVANIEINVSGLIRPNQLVRARACYKSGSVGFAIFCLFNAT